MPSVCTLASLTRKAGALSGISSQFHCRLVLSHVTLRCGDKTKAALLYRTSAQSQITRRLNDPEI